MALTLLR